MNKLFVSKATPLLEALHRGEPIIFHGLFSPALVKRLQTLFVNPPHLFINGERIPVNGPVTLVSSDASLFSGIHYQSIYYNPAVDFQTLPEPEQQRCKALYEELALAPCHAHFQHFRDNPMALRLAAGHQSALFEDKAPLTPATLLDALNHQPCLFLIGPSGTGKSELFLRGLPVYAKQQGLALQIHHGSKTIMDWIHQETGMAILFDDEANCRNQPLTPFYNLARGVFVIWLDGHPYPLDPLRHRVVWAGNYMRFEGRFEADLLRRFPCYLEVCPSMRLLNELLTPLLIRFQNPSALLALIKVHYQHALEAGLIITPRNAMMIVITTFALKHLPMLRHFSEEQIMLHAIAGEFKGIYSPKVNREPLLLELKPSTAEVEKAIQLLPSPPPGSDFILTDIHFEIARTLYRMLLVRDNKIKGIHEQHHGINGLLLEGPQGIGKTVFLGYLLTAWDIPFIEINTAFRQAADEQLIEAFHAGLIVLMDEINGLPNESLLNTLMSGTDRQGNPPKKPGLLVLATQNPVTVNNRQPLSDALANRFTVIQMKPYTSQELQRIATNKYQLSVESTFWLTDFFIKARTNAKKEGLPPPDERRFFKGAKTLAQRADQLTIIEALLAPVSEAKSQEVIPIRPDTISTLPVNHWHEILINTLSCAVSFGLIVAAGFLSAATGTEEAFIPGSTL